MDSLRPTVDAIWQVLDLPSPVEEIGRSYSFELSDMPVELRIESNGKTVSVRGLLGFLKSPERDAQDRLGRLLRFGAGLMVSNNAALDVPELHKLSGEAEDVSVAVYAVARAEIDKPATSIDALRQLIEWRGYAEPVLDQGSDAGSPLASLRNDDADIDSQMVIFQP